MRFSLVLAIFFVFSKPVFGLESESIRKANSQGQILFEFNGISPGQQSSFGLYVQLDPKWHTYWVNPGDSGAPAKINTQSNPPLEKSQIFWPIPHRISTPPLETFGYEGQVLFIVDFIAPQSLKVGSTLEVQFESEWLVCDDICIPAIHTFKVEIPVKTIDDIQPSPHQDLFVKNRESWPRVTSLLPKVKNHESVVTIEVPWTYPQSIKDVFPFPGSGLSNKKPEIKIENQVATLQFFKSPEPAIGPLQLLVIKDQKDGEPKALLIRSSTEPSSTSEGSLLGFILFAFFGGLLLNLMPCVFPVIFMKLYSLLNQSKAQPVYVRMSSISYSMGVILSFVAVAATLVALRQTGLAIGWGFQLQSPGFLIFMVLLFFILALNFLGWFEFNIPGTSIGQSLAQKKGLAGHFFTGVLSTLVASPCTAPYMGAAIGFALSQSFLVILIIFVSLGLGLSSPFLLFAVAPGALRFLPKPGAWMENLKQFMAFPIFATCVWLIWVILQITQIQSFLYVGAGLIFVAMSIWFYNRTLQLKFPLRLAISTVLFLLGLSFSYKATEAPTQQISSNPQTKVDSSGPFPWIGFSPEKVKELVAKNKLVFVDFTAAWCLSCKVNERVTFENESVIQFIKDNKIQMVKADWTQRDPQITKELEKYGRIGVPFYILYHSGSIENHVIFPEVLTPNIFKTKINTLIKTRR